MEFFYPYKWDYKWVTGIITPINGIITLLITGRGPPCRCFFQILLHPGRWIRLEPTAITHEKFQENDLNQASMRTCSMLIFRGVCSSLFYGNDPIWPICFKLGWNHQLVLGLGLFFWWFFTCFLHGTSVNHHKTHHLGEYVWNFFPTEKLIP